MHRRACLRLLRLRTPAEQRQHLVQMRRKDCAHLPAKRYESTRKMKAVGDEEAIKAQGSNAKVGRSFNHQATPKLGPRGQYLRCPSNSDAVLLSPTARMLRHSTNRAGMQTK
eukprot:781700-Pleurochrysis_carterae.AAC.1